MAEAMGAEHLELANTQYYAWALVNRDQLLPSREQLERAEEITNQFRARIGNRMKIYFVVPDYYATRPKACMNGWGSVFLNIAADGRSLALPRGAHAAGAHLPQRARARCALDLVRVARLQRISAAMSWMKEPCRTCPEKTKDFGGCRCQAYMLTGDAANADPVCDLSPHHDVVTGGRGQGAAGPDQGGYREKHSRPADRIQR